MSSQNARPKWWLLYLIFLLLIVFFVFDHQLKASTRGHEVVQLGIILLVYGLIYWWLKANSRAISRMDQQYYGKSRVIQTPVSQFIDVDNEKRSILQLPHSEVRGMLSDTFEIDQVSQQVNKE